MDAFFIVKKTIADVKAVVKVVQVERYKILPMALIGKREFGRSIA